MSIKQVKSPYGEGLSMSQVWCDVLNFLVGLSCTINGFSWRPRYFDPQILIFTGKMTRRINSKSLSFQVKL